LRLLTY